MFLLAQLDHAARFLGSRNASAGPQRTLRPARKVLSPVEGFAGQRGPGCGVAELCCRAALPMPGRRKASQPANRFCSATKRFCRVAMATLARPPANRAPRLPPSALCAALWLLRSRASHSAGTVLEYIDLEALRPTSPPARAPPPSDLVASPPLSDHSRDTDCQRGQARPEECAHQGARKRHSSDSSTACR